MGIIPSLKVLMEECGKEGKKKLMVKRNPLLAARDFARGGQKATCLQVQKDKQTGERRRKKFKGSAYRGKGTILSCSSRPSSIVLRSAQNQGKGNAKNARGGD